MSTIRILLRAAPGPGEEHVTLFTRQVSIREIASLIADGGPLDSVHVRKGVDLQFAMPVGAGGPDLEPARLRVPSGYAMLVDDSGLINGKPLNYLASQVYAAQCRPGAPAIIAGDAFLCPDDDFA